MKTLTTSQMREADRRCIEELGIPGVVLMNNAGLAVFQEVHEGPVGIVCGKGNNGGDGYVVARLALLKGLAPEVFILAQPGDIRGDAKVFLIAYEKLGGQVTYVQSEEDAQAALLQLAQCKTLVDAMLGTGVQGEVRGLFKTFITQWPSVYTVAVDLPSGMNADTGEACGACIHADVTVTLQCAKTGMLNECAKPYLGRLVVADIGIPEVCCDDAAWAALQAKVDN
jgi:NAD(P)H-hydrate epimerase